jgi:hypothetical protein
MRQGYALEPDEVARVNVIRMAKYLGKLPHEIRAMPYLDYCDVLSVMRADIEIDERRAYLRKARG